MANGRYLENRCDIITPPPVALFGWNLVLRCRIKCQWRWQDQIETGKIISIWQTLFFWTGSSYMYWAAAATILKIDNMSTPPRVVRYGWNIQCGMLKQNDMMITAIMKIETEKTTDWKRRIAHWSLIPACKSRMLFLCDSLRFGRCDVPRLDVEYC